MKLFFGIILVAIIIGGFAGGEILEISFSIVGAAVGGISTAAVLLGLGAYFDSQDKKSSDLSPEIRGVFDRMITGSPHPTPQEIRAAKKRHLPTSQPPQTTNSVRENSRFSIEGVMQNLMTQDAEILARGEIPERRLIPHHAIKRDIIIAAYTADFDVAEKRILELSWTEEQKNQQLKEMRKDFDKKIYGIKRLSWQELDEIISLMKKMRTDLKEIEQNIRSKSPQYTIVDPL